MSTEDYTWLRLTDIIFDSDMGLNDIGHEFAKTHPQGSLEPEREAVIQLIQTVSQFMLGTDNFNEPFGPLWHSGAKRGAIPADLTAEELSVLSDLSELEMNPLLQARFKDILWCRRHGDKPHLHGMSASENYLKAYREADGEHRWVRLGNEFRRGVLLAGKFGCENALYVDYQTFIHDTLSEIEATTKTWDARWYLERLSEDPEADYADLASRSFEVGVRLKKSGETSSVASYFSQAHRFFQKANDEFNSKLALRREGQLLLLDARANFTRSKMAAAHHLSRAIQLLDEAGAPKKIRDLLRRKLLRWQNDSRNEFSHFEHSTDITGYVKSSKEIVTQDSIEDAIFAFASGHPVVAYDSVRKEVLEERPRWITNFMSSALIAPDGRTIAGTGTIDENADEETVENHMIDHASRFVWSFRAQGFINPARWQIFSQHHPTQDDLLFLVRGNPVIPPGHEELFLRGIWAGFHGDAIQSVSILAPQLENLVRHNLKKSGVVTSKLDSDLIQDEKTLGTLLDMPESRKVFGEDLTLELKGILCSRHGYNLRNEVAHGMLPANDFFSIGGINLWWLTIHLIGLGYYEAGPGKDDTAEAVDC